MVKQAKINGRTACDIDLMVGENLRVLRLSAGLSQAEIADHLGISFQQYQKYEKGANRISAGRLYKAAQILQVNVETLFIYSNDLSRSHQPNSLGKEEMALLRSFSKIKDPELKRSLIKLIDATILQS